MTPTAPSSSETESGRTATAFWIVVIGRNEGERLVRCFDAISKSGATVAYVDSASTDGSVQMARARGLEVVELDMSIPFTASRARNAGVARLHEVAPPAQLIQFIDGDCEIIDGWFEAATAFIAQQPSVACVCGGLRERFPERSVYNRIADQSASVRSGRINACGGIALMRLDVFDTVGGFRDDLFAGEEAELCLRMRNAGWQIWRLPLQMCWHDSAMLRFSQWWKRTRRVGYAYAQAASMYGEQDRRMIREAFRVWIWGALLPLAIVVGMAWAGPMALALLLIYPMQIARVSSSMAGKPADRLLSAAFLVLGKFPEMLGQCQYWLSRNRGSVASSFHKS